MLGAKKLGYSVTRYYPVAVKTTESDILDHLLDSTRRKIIFFLLEHSNCRFKEIVYHVNRAPSTTSFQLQRLERVGIISVLRINRNSQYYRLKNKSRIIRTASKYKTTNNQKIVTNAIKFFTFVNFTSYISVYDYIISYGKRSCLQHDGWRKESAAHIWSKWTKSLFVFSTMQKSIWSESKKIWILKAASEFFLYIAWPKKDILIN